MLTKEVDEPQRSVTMNSNVVGRRKNLPKLCALFVVVAMLSLGIVTVAGNDEGMVSAEPPLGAIQIDSADELRLIGNDINYPLDGDYVVTTNLELGGSSNPFTPIGTPTEPFTGTFWGQNKQIKDIYISTDDGNAAMFGYVSGNAVIDSVFMVGGSVTTETPRYPSSESIAAAVVGEIFGEGDITIAQCFNSSVTVTSTTYTAGGVVGIIREPTGPLSVLIWGCTNLSPVSAFNLAGGIVGKIYGGDVTVFKCVNNGEISSVTGTDFVNFKTSLGGIIGWASSYVDISYCYNFGDITATEVVGYGYAGGIAGITYGSITECVNHGIISASVAKPDASHFDQGRILIPKEREYDVTEDPIFDDPTVYSPVYRVRAGGLVGYMGGGSIEFGTLVTNPLNYGDVTAKGLDARAGGIIGYSMVPISGINNEGKISAFGLSEVDYQAEGVTYAGGIVGYAKGNIASVENNGKILASSGLNNRAGGIAGYMVATYSITDALNRSMVTAHGTAEPGHSYAGGIVGITYGYVFMSTTTNFAAANCVITAEGYYARSGGIAGIVEPGGKIENCDNYANIVAFSAGFESTAGGIAGFLVKGDTSIESSINRSVVRAEGIKNARAVAGGIVGKSEEYTTINACSNISHYSNFRIWAVSERASLGGGIAGIANGSITNSVYIGEYDPSPVLIKTLIVNSHAPTAYAGGIAAMTGALSYIHDNQIDYVKINVEYKIRSYYSEIVGNATVGTDMDNNTFDHLELISSTY